MGKHVLVPLDGSEPAWKALEYAAEEAGADRITVVHVVDAADHVYADPDGGHFDEGLFDRAVERGEKLCERAREHLRDAEAADSIEVDTAIETGRPARTIVAYARDNDVDHVVIGSHGRSGFSRLLLGSVAEAVVRRAPVPVTVVR